MAKPIIVEDAIQLLLDHLRVERQVSSNTLSAYGSDLARFARESIEARRRPVFVAKVAEADVLAHMARLNAAGLSVGSQKRNLTAMRCLFRFLVSEKIIDHDPSEMVDLPRRVRTIPDYLTNEEADKLLACPDRTTRNGLRDATMLAFAYATGLSVSELVKIRIGDVNAEAGYLKTVGKGRQGRMIPMGKVASTIFRQYMADVRQKTPPSGPGTPLFLSNRRSSMTRQRFDQIVRCHAGTAGITKNLSPHTLRHSFAAHLVAGGADLLTVQAMLGHSDLETTKVYINVFQTQMLEVDRQHPPA